MIYINFDNLMKDKMANGKPLTMLQLSKETGIGRANLYNLKNGKANGIEFNTLNTLVQYFNVPINKILKYSNENVYIDIYDYKHFYSEQDLKEFYDTQYNKNIDAMKSGVTNGYVKNYMNKIKKEARDTAYSTVYPIKDALFIQYTFKDKQHISNILPLWNTNKNTINPNISEGMVNPVAFSKNNGRMIDDSIEFIKKDEYFYRTIINQLPYNQQLFLLCRSIQFTNSLNEQPISTNKLNYHNIDRSITKNVKGVDNRTKHGAWIKTENNKISKFTKNTEYILKIVNHGADKQYRMTKEQILNYKQPSQNNFNSNIYNFIIRDHTKK